MLTPAFLGYDAKKTRGRARVGGWRDGVTEIPNNL